MLLVAMDLLEEVVEEFLLKSLAGMMTPCSWFMVWPITKKIITSLLLPKSL